MGFRKRGGCHHYGLSGAWALWTGWIGPEAGEVGEVGSRRILYNKSDGPPSLLEYLTSPDHSIDQGHPSVFDTSQ